MGHAPGLDCHDHMTIDHRGSRPSRMPRPKATDALLSPAESRALLKATEGKPRDRAIVMLFARSGLKSNELRMLDLADYRPDRHQIMVRAVRGGRQRVVPIGDPVIEAIDKWLKERPNSSIPALFMTRVHTRISNRHLRNLIKGIGRQAGITRDLHPQALVPMVNVDDPLIRATLGGSDEEDAQSSVEGLLEVVDAMRSLLIAVALGDPTPQAAEDEYRTRWTAISRALERLGLANPFPWRSVWDWLAYYSRHLATPTEKRNYVADLVEPLVAELEARASPRMGDKWRAGWGFVQARLSQLESRMRSAVSVDDFQDIGRRAREIVVSATNLVFRDSMVSPGVSIPKGADARSRLEIVLASEMGMRLRPELRALLRELMQRLWDQAQTLTHSSSATRLDASVVSQMTAALARSLMELDTATSR